jgi:hypothetical protein
VAPATEHCGSASARVFSFADGEVHRELPLRNWPPMKIDEYDF